MGCEFDVLYYRIGPLRSKTSLHVPFRLLFKQTLARQYTAGKKTNYPTIQYRSNKVKINTTINVVALIGEGGAERKTSAPVVPPNLASPLLLKQGVIIES